MPRHVAAAGAARLAVVPALLLAGLAGESLARSGRVQLLVVSRPAGATVYLDDEERGTTPLSLMNVAAGVRVVRVEFEGYQTWTKRVSLDPGPNTVTAELTRAASPRPVAEGAGEGAARPDGRAAEEGGSTEPEEVPRAIDVDCPCCTGSGLVRETGCPTCGADGHVRHTACVDCGAKARKAYGCPGCRGTGAVTVGGKEVDCRLCRGKGAPRCPICGKTNLNWCGFYHTPAGRFKAFRCKDCGGIGRSRYSDLSKAEKQNLVRAVAR